MFSIFFNKINWYKRVLLSLFGFKRSYKIYKFIIKIDYKHLLPDYQLIHPFYDKFLPHLVKYLPENSIVIDVGANVGDTLAGMASNNNRLNYFCIEASKHYFSNLKENTDLLRNQCNDLNVFLCNEFVGNEINGIRLEGEGGTKHAVIEGGEIKSRSIYSILSDFNIQSDSVSLLKTDVDGFDWDVIRSSYKSIKHCPYLYFECEYNNNKQFNSYKEIFIELMKMGYSQFAFFDNFGQYILTTNDLSEIFKLLDYVKRQNHELSTRTIFYYDVLAYSNDKKKECDLILSDYIINV